MQSYERGAEGRKCRYFCALNCSFELAELKMVFDTWRSFLEDSPRISGNHVNKLWN